MSKTFKIVGAIAFSMQWAVYVQNSCTVCRDSGVRKRRLFWLKGKHCPFAEGLTPARCLRYCLYSCMENTAMHECIIKSAWQLCICLRPILYIDPVRDWEGLIYNYNYIRVCVRYIPIAVIFYFIDAIFKRCGFTNFTRSTDATRDVSSVLAWVGIIKWSIKNRKTVKIISDMEI